MTPQHLDRLIKNLTPGYRWHVRMLLAESKRLYRQAERTARQEQPRIRRIRPKNSQ